MKKSFIILTVCSILTACAGQSPQTEAPSVLLSFDAIAAEITVTHENLPAEPAPVQTAHNR